MPIFVIFGNMIGGFCPACEAAGAILIDDIPRVLIIKILMNVRVYNITNRLIELFCKNIWNKFAFEKNINCDKDIYFLFDEGHFLTYQWSFLKYLRRKYKRSRIIFVFRNGLSQYDVILRRWNDIKKHYDAGITMNETDAQKLGILYCDYWPCLLPDKELQIEHQSDAFFVGQAKDRLPKILDVYERLTGAGLKCDFAVAGVPEQEQKYSHDINYGWLTYDEVLQHVMNTKCVLEILPFGQNYSSLRPVEAMWYHKKLLTTNLHAPKEWFYNPEIVQVFSDAGEIDTDFLRRPVNPEIFEKTKAGDFNIFADWLMKNVPL